MYFYIMFLLISDPRFSETGKVEFVFGPTAEGLVSGE